MAKDYTGITDTEFLDLDAKAKKLRDSIPEKKKALDELLKQFNENPPVNIGPNRARDKMIQQINALDAELISLSGQAATLEAKRETRGATVTQGGVNVEAGTAAGAAIKNENLLAQNIGQEIQGRIAKNTQQAQEAATGVNLLDKAARGRQAAKAGQAGYGMASGTAGALAAASKSKSAEDLSAIEGYRLGRQNLLMGQGEAATKAAESLTGTIDTTTKDWAQKSTSAITDVTGTLLKNVDTIVAAPGFTGDPGPGVDAAYGAVDTALDTWDINSYLDVLNTLTGKSANKSTWDQMLLDQASPAANPYGQFGGGLEPLTPATSKNKNLLAAAAGAPDTVYTLSGTTSKSGGLL